MHLRPPYLPCPGLTSGSTLPSSAPALPLQVPILKQHLKGKLIGGQEWRAGSKKRDDLIADFRCGCGADVAAGLGPCLVGRGTAAAAQQTCQRTCSAVELMSACRSVPHYPASNRLPACLPACPSFHEQGVSGPARCGAHQPRLLTGRLPVLLEHQGRAAGARGCRPFLPGEL